MMEEDADFFPRNAGELTINEPNLAHLEEALASIHERAKYYGEYSLTKLDFVDMIENLQKMAGAIRRTAR